MYIDSKKRNFEFDAELEDYTGYILWSLIELDYLIALRQI